MSWLILYISFTGALYSHSVHPGRTSFAIVLAFLTAWFLAPIDFIKWVAGGRKPECRHISTIKDLNK